MGLLLVRLVPVAADVLVEGGEDAIKALCVHDGRPLLRLGSEGALAEGAEGGRRALRG